MLFALALVALAGAAAVAVGLAVTRDFQRSQRQADEAQLRQLLLAGAADAAGRVASAEGPQAEWTIALPKELADRGRALRATRDETKSDSIAIVVHAELAGHVREQQLRFTKADGRWRLTSATVVR